MISTLIAYPDEGRYPGKSAGRYRCCAGGRNGYAYATGVFILQYAGEDSRVTVLPVTSRGMTLTGAMLDLPPDPATLRTLARWLEAAASDIEAGGTTHA